MFHFSKPLILSALTLSPLFTAMAEIDFNREIRPILSENCFQCHGPDEHGRKGKLRLDRFEDATAKDAIVPGDSMKSEFVVRILSADEDELMPPPDSHRKLNKDQKDLLIRWINEGAEYADHWSFITPSKSGLPVIKNTEWPRNAIDHFALARIEAANLQPSPEATREQLIRRVTEDLTGLPPTLQEIDAFVADSSADAFEKVVDRLLASPHFGERMTLAWMDAARYGDSSVMHADGNRDMWPWRDWVINAYNTNKPFDKFTIEQLAGDLLPDATVDQKIATGFNRNHATSDEGGAFAEELRVEYVVDRVKTTSNVWLGLSMECAQCHDHKYDPIPITDYYSFFAYFNNTKDPGMQSRSGNQAPVVSVPSNERKKAKEAFAAKRISLDEKLAVRRLELTPVIAKWAVEKSAALAIDPDKANTAVPDLALHIPLDAPDKHTESISGTSAKTSKKVVADSRDGAPAVKLTGNAVLDFPGIGDIKKHSDPFSISVWIKAPKNGNGAVLAKMKTSQSYRGYDIWLQGGGIGTHIINKWQDNAVKVVSKSHIKPDAWNHVAVTYDGSGKAAGTLIYINGERSDTTVEADGLTGDISNDVPFRIGGRDANAFSNVSVDDVRLYTRALSPEEIPIVSEGKDPLNELLTVPADQRTPDQNKALANLYLSREDKVFQDLTTQRAAIDTQEAEQLKKHPEYTSMVMEDNDKMRMTYVLDRGAYDSPKKDNEIRPSTPSAVFPALENAEENRLGLAKWLTHPEHPLTSRVAVNRYWAMLFGTGIVKSVTDFGNQGAAPTHPELLDWLAVDFVENGWDIKRTLRQIVTSATYRQSSVFSNSLRDVDPENKLLARSPRFRLQGEFIRDHALAVSGLLKSDIGGIGVKPYQPKNIWNEVSLNGGLRYPQDKGEKLYRRSMYTYWKRSAPMPNMIIFDAPSRETCIVQRPVTNTPLQALVTLNDPQFVEAARVFAARILREGGDTDEKRINHALRLATGRHASPREIQILANTLSIKKAAFTADVETAKQYLSVGEHPRDETIPLPDHAAWTIIAQMILNLDETLTRG